MGINGYSLTFEQKVLRRVQSMYEHLETAPDYDVKRFWNGLLPEVRLKIMSDVFEEVFSK